MNLQEKIASRTLHRKRYGWARGDLAAVRADARAGTKGRTPGIVTAEEAAAIHEAERRVQAELDLIRRRDRQIAEALKTGRPRESFRVSVRNQSSRGRARPRIIVLHTTESTNVAGLADLRAVAGWFDNPKAQASSHVIVDAEGNSCQCVPDGRKAWTQANRNPEALSIEQIARAFQGGPFTAAGYLKSAQYLAYWHREFGIPLVSSTTHGVCQHVQLGAAGGGHVDCGPKFDMARLLKLARDIA